MININIQPVPASRPRVTRWGTYYTKKYTQFRNDLREELNKLTFNKIGAGIPIKFTVTFNMGFPKSYSKKKRIELLENNHHVIRPDLDNLIKGLLDGLNGIAFEDDSQIIELNIKKQWSIVPSIKFKYVSIEKSISVFDREF